MSEIQRYQPFVYCDGKITASVDLHVKNDGAYCLYSDLSFYRRQYHMAVCALIGVCAVFAAFLVTGKHAPQQVQKAAVQESQPSHEFKERIDRLVYEQLKAEAEQLRRELERKKAVRQKKMEIHEVTAKAQTAKFEELKQAEAQIPTATPMHDGELFKLAKGFGFTKVRVVE